MSDTRVLTGLFPDHVSAECAYQNLTGHGHGRHDVDRVLSPKTGTAVTTAMGSKAAAGTGIGAGVGGVFGAVVAALAGVGGSMALPGLGLVIAGPIATALVGAGAGGAAGGLLGALIGWGLPEERLKEDHGVQVERAWRDASADAVCR